MEGLPVSGVCTGKIADHVGCSDFPSAFAMVCKQKQAN